MKRRLRIYIYTMFIVLMGSIMAVAQTTNQSRLNMAYKKAPVKSNNQPLSAAPFAISNKPLILNQTKALGNYYRTLLFGDTSTTTSTTPESVTPNVVEASQVEVKTEDFNDNSMESEYLYSSEKIAVKNLYPNPSNEYAYLDYTSSGSVKEAKILLYNILGATVREFVLPKSNQRLTIDTRQLPNGVYFYQLTIDGQKVATKKLIVRHHQ